MSWNNFRHHRVIRTSTQHTVFWQHVTHGESSHLCANIAVARRWAESLAKDSFVVPGSIVIRDDQTRSTVR